MIALRYILATMTFLAFILPCTAESQIYKTVDEDGNVVFTDIPPRTDDTAVEQIVIETPNSFAVDEAIPAQDAWIVDTPEESEEPPFRYKTLEIASPADDESIRENAGNITIVANISPRLQRGHVMRLLMDGEIAQEGSQATFSLANVDRGTHTLALEIVNGAGEVQLRSANSTFHLLRYAIRPRPAG